MHIIRKGQVRLLAKSDIAQQVRFIKCIFELATGSVHSSHNLLAVLAHLFATEP
jgi:hypothetical protein